MIEAMTEKGSKGPVLSNGLGMILIVASLILTSPGVKTVRAAEPSLPEVSAQGGVVKASTMTKAQAKPGGNPEDVVVLNTRGYNYGPDRPVAVPEASKSPAAPANLDSKNKAKSAPKTR